MITRCRLTGEDYDDDLTPPGALDNFWRAVIEQHLRDGIARGISSTMRYARRDARAWFAARDPSFYYICELAGLDPDDLGTRAAVLFEKADRGEIKASRKRKHTLYRYNGKSLDLVQWSELTGIDLGTLQKRITKLGWSIERALSEPFQSQKTQQCHEAENRGAGEMSLEAAGTGTPSPAQD